MRNVTGLLLALLCGVILSSASVFAEEVTLDQIIKAVQENEKQLSNCKIEYTVTKQLYHADKRELTAEEKAKMERYPGHYLPEQGVLKMKGKKIKLERFPYLPKSKDKKEHHTMAYDGDIICTEKKVDKTGVVAQGRTHLFRTHFNPILMYSATGDMSLSEELQIMNAELASETVNINGTPCREIKLYKMAAVDSDKISRTFKVYLDPARNYSLLKVEKYWYDLRYLERTMQVTEFTGQGSDSTPVKALQVKYNRKYKATSTQPLIEEQLTVQLADKNVTSLEDDFVLTYGAETLVWDDIIKKSFKISSDDIEKIIEPKL